VINPTFQHQYFDSVACFAGDNDELVAVGSEDNNIYIWSVSEEEGSRVNNRPVMSLSGNEEEILYVHYIAANSILASCGMDTVIKLWSPFSLPISSQFC